MHDTTVNFGPRQQKASCSKPQSSNAQEGFDFETEFQHFKDLYQKMNAEERAEILNCFDKIDAQERQPSGSFLHDSSGEGKGELAKRTEEMIKVAGGDLLGLLLYIFQTSPGLAEDFMQQMQAHRSSQQEADMRMTPLNALKMQQDASLSDEQYDIAQKLLPKRLPSLALVKKEMEECRQP